jgi:NADPH:quinone reductase-like Zn-dependent oxidoreductase
MLTAAGAIPAQMKAVVFTEHGSPDVLKVTDLEVPTPKDSQVRLRVRAASLNPLDWHLVRGEPALMKLMARGEHKIPGVDVAGEVVSVGAKVTQFRPGDAVFGSAWRACAEYVCTAEEKLVPKPARLSFEQAAAIPVAAYTSLYALRHYGQVQPGRTVLINGASGGVGTMAVQIARALGAEVTGVCSTRNLDFVRSIGAHHAIDYTVEDFAAMDRKWDVVVQVAGNRTSAEIRRALAPHGIGVLVGGGTGRDPNEQIRMFDILRDMAGNLVAPFTKQKVYLCMASGRRTDLIYTTELVEAGKVTPVLDRVYPLAEAAEAMRYLEAGHVRGKVVVTP